jgi:hypothetical protein
MDAPDEADVHRQSTRSPKETVMTSLAVPHPSAHAAPARPRRTAWPYAGVVSAVASGASGVLLVQGPGTFTDGTTWATTDRVVTNLATASTAKLGAGLGLLALVAAFAFLLGLTRFVARHAPLRGGLVEAMRWASIAFLATGSIGVTIRYVAAGGVSGGIDVAMYTREAAATLAVLADQLSTAAFLPVLVVMALLGVATLRDRVLTPAVGVFALLLTAVSLGMTVVLGLPYSASLAYPLFALVVGIAGLLTRRPA